MMNRKIRTKIPALIKPIKNKVHMEARKKDAATRQERKTKLDKRRRAKDIEYKEGDKVLIKQKKTTIKPPFDPKPYTITKVEGMQITAERGDKIRVRNKAKWKLIKDRPSRLQPRPRDSQDGDSDSDDDWYTGPAVQQQEVAGENQEEGVDGGEEEVDEETEEPEEEATHSPIASRTRRKAERSAQPSPRERKRRKAQAMKMDKQDRGARNREELRVIMKVKERWITSNEREDVLEPEEGSE